MYMNSMIMHKIACGLTHFTHHHQLRCTVHRHCRWPATAATAALCGCKPTSRPCKRVFTVYTCSRVDDDDDNNAADNNYVTVTFHLLVRCALALKIRVCLCCLSRHVCMFVHMHFMHACDLHILYNVPA